MAADKIQSWKLAAKKYLTEIFSLERKIWWIFIPTLITFLFIFLPPIHNVTDFWDIRKLPLQVIIILTQFFALQALRVKIKKHNYQKEMLVKISRTIERAKNTPLAKNKNRFLSLAEKQNQISLRHESEQFGLLSQLIPLASFGFALLLLFWLTRNNQTFGLFLP